MDLLTPLKSTDEAPGLTPTQELLGLKLERIADIVSFESEVSDTQLIRLGGLAIQDFWAPHPDRYPDELSDFYRHDLTRLRVIVDLTHPEIGVERPKRIAVDTAPGITSYIRPEHIDPDAPWRLPAAENLLKAVGEDVLKHWVRGNPVDETIAIERRIAAAQARSRHSQ